MAQGSPHPFREKCTSQGMPQQTDAGDTARDVAEHNSVERNNLASPNTLHSTKLIFSAS
jgi:hypothetical protein